MQFQWITLVLLAASLSCNTASPVNSNTAPAPAAAAAADLDNRDIMRLWVAALQAINEAELQRRSQQQASVSGAPQRINSKRLRWRSNSKLLDARSLQRQPEVNEEEQEEYLDPVEARQNTYPTLSQLPEVNPAYIDVRDFTPAPPTWWF
ncbi:hypothetical protein KR093_004132 [Drosophila rubida]|uniref:Secreted protein n=1 Tax=Drosophila rubida TaxID=30044 RepID=A0AAD4KA05_9MUSC|nr:hypothetical protein KR093_004132 [Drosophila rubida]